MLVIRDADPDRDGPDCAEIYAPFVTETAVTFEEEPVGGAEMSRRIASIMHSHPWIVADWEGTLAGYAYASRHRKRAAYRWSAEVGIYVSSTHRRRGIGRALYEALLPMLGRQGLHVALAGITLPNPASVALHEAVGFRPIGVYRAVGWKAGGWRDVGWWQVRLSEEGPPAEPGPPPRLGGLRSPAGEEPASGRR